MNQWTKMTQMKMIYSLADYDETTAVDVRQAQIMMWKTQALRKEAKFSWLVTYFSLLDYFCMLVYEQMVCAML